MNILNKNSNEYINQRLDEIDERLHQSSIGLTNVYEEFKKYELSKIESKIDDLLIKIKNYELQKEVVSLDVDIKKYPMEIAVKISVETNFGDVVNKLTYPPSLEYQLSHVIQAAYVHMLNRLYETHDARGGKYMGDEGCKQWMDDNGKTHIDLNDD